jgi:hypothetical protein
VRTTGALRLLPLIILIAAPAAHGQDKAGAAKADYMPLKVGNKWTYKLDFGGQMVSVNQKVTKVEKKDGTDVATVESEFMGQTMNEQTSSSDKGIFRYSFQGMAVDPPIQALKLPYKKGDAWEAKFKIQGQEQSAKMKSEGEEDVTVPAGKYKALVVSMEMDIMGQQVSAKSWFAADVGIVKQTFSFGGLNGSSELEKVELAK